MTETMIKITMAPYLKKGMPENEARATAIAELEARAAAKAAREAESLEKGRIQDAINAAKMEAKNTPERMARNLAKIEADKALDARQAAFMATLSEEQKVEFFAFIDKQMVMGQRGIQIATPSKFQY